MDRVNLDMLHTQPLLQAAALICTFLKVTPAHGCELRPLVSGKEEDF